MRNVTLACCLLALFASALRGQSQGIHWEADWGSGLKRAQAEGKPLMVAFIMDAEPANDEVARLHFHDEKVVAASKDFVCMIAALGTHDPVTGGSEICSRFGCVKCTEHRAMHIRAQEALLRSDQVSAPQFVFVKPDGKSVILRHVWMLAPQQLVKKMNVALALHDPSKGGELLKEMRADVESKIAAAADNNASKRQAALDELLALDDPRIDEFLVRQTAETVDEQKRLEAIDAMGGARSNGTIAAVLHKLLESKSSQVRAHAAVAVERLGQAESGPALAAALKRESKERVRSDLIRALAVCDPITPAYRKAVISAIGQGSQSERIAAIRAVIPFRGDDGVNKALLAAAKDSAAQVRAAAYSALARRDVRDAVGLLRSAVKTEKLLDVRNLANASLARITGESWPGPDGESAVSVNLIDEDLRSKK